MKRVLIIGAGRGGTALIHIIKATTSMEIVGVIDIDSAAKGLQLARDLNIKTGTNWKEWADENIDIIIEVTGNKEVLDEIIAVKNNDTVVVPGTVAYIISQLDNDKNKLLNQMKEISENQKLILEHIRDGMIVIDQDNIIQFVNHSAAEILGTSKQKIEKQDIRQLIPSSRLPNVLSTRKKEVNQKFELDNGKQVITTRIPLISNRNELIGAFTLFKDITEVEKLAEENTNLNEIKTLLESIINSTEDAISVVDENGKGILINPAYTRITGLEEEDIIGKPASVDIYEGESMHLKVLKTGETYRGVRMKLSKKKQDVIVNVAPIVVNGFIKGSVGVIHDVSEIQTLTRELKQAKQIIRDLEAKYTFDDIIGSSSEIKLALDQAKIGAKTPVSVLLRGNSGTGKELFAHAIHNESNRIKNKFIRINCSAIDDEKLERELFGYEMSGSTKGSKSIQQGLFEEVTGGTIFLDEIGELSLRIQGRILRVLQDKEIVRIGGKNPVSIDVQIIAATNMNLEKEMVNRTFREDLYYRLNRFPIFIPPLKERITDLPELTQHFIQKLNKEYGRSVSSVSDDAFALLKAYDWPGNVRELDNVLARAMIYMHTNEEVINKKHLPSLVMHTNPKINGTSMFTEGETLSEAVEEFEKEYIYKIYEGYNFNKTKTAKALGISIRNLYYKLEKHQLE